MYTQKRIEIWIDEDSAHLIEFRKLRVETVIIRARIKEKEKFLQPKEELIDDSNLQENFFKKISEQLKDFEEILVFGPDDAKQSFEKYLKMTILFADKNIILQIADKMTDNHKHAFVNKHFKTLSYKKNEK
ncbi:hypothetical protein EGI26_20200 [Lacihabitans sp. CCS-44]|uniref:hypothetical protein n=1 Tax=Lacihabitans sp. CCS-44 TaxID=2487331 RepID=UPI0020CB91D8|nr:hypothetical protein [Lacihabitans sp. CCS-44]MCP9757490.1 hypothetical protein [Lacihabitans sp. CCS-44]